MLPQKSFQILYFAEQEDNSTRSRHVQPSKSHIGPGFPLNAHQWQAQASRKQKVEDISFWLNSEAG